MQLARNDNLAIKILLDFIAWQRHLISETEVQVEANYSW